MLTLAELLRDVTLLAPLSEAELATPIAEVRDDSRQVGAGDLFVALVGQTVDGHQFLPVVRERGAVAVVVDREVAFDGIVVRVADTARALATIAANRYRRPADALALVGITGTNGKTTCSYLVEALLREHGAIPGVIGTVAYRSPAGTRPAPFTTPTPLQLHATLAEMRDAGCTHVVMEVSSHALALDRLAGVHFVVGAFTNLTQDHLDFHADMNDYAAAKARLFANHLRGTAVICVDGPYAKTMIAASTGAVMQVSSGGQGGVHVLSRSGSVDGTQLRLATPLGEAGFTSPLVGDFNIENLVVATGVACALHVTPTEIARALSHVTGAPGRLERVMDARLVARRIAVYVDYAHTPDALRRVLAAVRPTTAGRLWVVFGCGGDRDRGKRPQMGAIAMHHADVAVVTSDNPRTEDPDAIVADIVAGMQDGLELAPDGGGKGRVVRVDRAAAIAFAVRHAGENDIVVIAGKGHEDYQIVGREKLHFDDREQVTAALDHLG
jgi:UDP-N-acetylmuramyl-tripeptide synthetase